jgi:hypothetical protein
MLLVLAFDRAHGGGDENHAGVGLKTLVIDKTDLFVAGLLILETELHPGESWQAPAPAAEQH